MDESKEITARLGQVGSSGNERDVDEALRVDQTTIQVGGDDSSRTALHTAESAGGYKEAYTLEACCQIQHDDIGVDCQLSTKEEDWIKGNAFHVSAADS
jgi:hypothetical protein